MHVEGTMMPVDIQWIAEWAQRQPLTMDSILSMVIEFKFNETDNLLS